MSQLILDPTPQNSDSQLNQGLLKYKGKLYVGSNQRIKQKIIKALHESSIWGYSGQRACTQRIKSIFYWPGMKKEIIQFIQECDICQRNKNEHLSYPGLLQPLPIPTQAWSHITMDFIERLHPSKGFDTILVVIDMLTKFGHSIPLTHPFSYQ